MKTFNTKLILALITTLVLTGCVPDSLTKFKKDAPIKEAEKGPLPSMVDSNGNAVDPESLVYPSKFYFISDGAIPTIERPVGAPMEIEPITDGSLTDPNLRNLLFIKCALVTNADVGTTRTDVPPGLVFDTQSCKFTGTPTATHYNSNNTPVQYTVEMSYKGPDYNGVGTELKKNASVKIGIYEAPSDLSYTTRQLIEVTTNLSFNEGETLLQPISPPAATSIAAKILRKVDSNKLSIETVNGNFLAQATLDSGNVFSLVKTSITIGSSPNYYNIALTLSVGTDMTRFPVKGYVTSSNGAKGIIVERDIAERVIYIRFLTPSVISSNPLVVNPTLIKTFNEGDNIDNASSYIASEATIDQIEASNMVMTLTPSAAAFTAGHDITSSAFHSGYIYEQSSNTIKVDEINRTGALGVQAPGSPFLRRLQTVSNSEYYTGAMQTIQTVTHDNLLVIDRGVPRTIYANVSKGTSLTYSISPSLPAGLSIDPLTGMISGAAEFMTPRTTYVVTASNTLGNAFYAFDMEVRDYFTFADTTGAKSFLTHKVGDNKTHRACRINAKDILNANPLDPLTTAGLDIGCILEAEEMDLYYTTLKLSAMVGPGTCEYVTFTPYAFWQYPPLKTKRKVDVITDCVPTAAQENPIAEVPKIEDYCLGNYSNDEGPNCDTGAITAVVWSGVAAGDACTIPLTQTIQCSGRKAACLAGPVTSVLTSTIDLDNGSRGVFIESYAGMKKEWSIDSPYKSLDSTNLRNANGLISNQCTDSRVDASKWANLQRSIQSIKTPFGGESPFYEFNCLDAAQDVKARIRLTIRDWDRSFKIKDNITELIPASLLMNATGTTPLGISWNNNYDWDDNFSSVYPTNSVQALSCGALPAGTCSGGGHPTITTCKAAGYTWNDPGTCSSRKDVPPTTRKACEDDNETWIPTTEGTCSVVPATNTTKALCSGAGGIWTLREFPFPGGDL